jgi:thiol-disulfide isomerase/thioredoxin
MRTLLYTTLVLCLSSFSLTGQNAPNFVIEATDGNEYELYADFLDQGKTVVLELMFTSCPPCNSFAPYIEMIYKDWGRGDYDVEMISLTTKNFDTQQDMAARKQQYGHTFLAAGANGGSLNAVDLYTDGTFGVWFGTPTWIVIAPDRSVQFNIGNGSSGAGKAMVISNAIAASGAVKPPVEVDFDGTVHNALGQAILGVELGLEQTNISLDTTGMDGSFIFNQELPQDSMHRVVASKMGNPLNGVTTYDMVLIAKHILAVSLFDDPYKIVAADVNLSGTITTADLVKIRKLILFIDTEMDKSWRFVDANCDLSNQSCSLDEVIEFEPSDGDQNGLSIIGIKVGDVNNSANPELLFETDDRSATDQLSFTLSNEKITAGEVISIPFTSSNFDQISAYQFTLNFDKNALQYLNYQSENLNLSDQNFNEKFLEDGIITTQWYDVTEQTFHPEEVLFYLDFMVKENAKLEDLIEINSTLTQAEAYDADGNNLDLNLTFESKEKPSMTVYPNPTFDDLNIQFNLVEDGDVSFEIYNTVGQLQSVVLEESLAANQVYESTLPTANLSPNIYFVKIRKGAETIGIQRFVKK